MEANGTFKEQGQNCKNQQQRQLKKDSIDCTMHSTTKHIPRKIQLSETPPETYSSVKIAGGTLQVPGHYPDAKSILQRNAVK
jgi:hypothetical protein